MDGAKLIQLFVAFHHSLFLYLIHVSFIRLFYGISTQGGIACSLLVRYGHLALGNQIP